MFSFVYFLCVGILILKIVLPQGNELVFFDVVL